MKKLLALLAVLTLIFSVAGCSSDKTKDTTVKKENKNALTDQVKAKMYNAIRMAEGKSATVYQHDVAADGTTPILNPSFADEAAAETFLTKYYGEDLAKQIVAYYTTGKKTAEGQTIVKADPFFAPSFLETTQKDATFEGDANKGTVKTTDHGTYTVELKDGNYIVTSYQK
ncbi:endonuclease [Neobacillus sp. PS3-34]|uniref:endonuclease n=1 Tax=Neobacillus sp. PS3-34 TaxID=3070678 RepID=UPI0027DF156B|nr:endonuclease [Neobacillus sp. PS3-34]WML47407.1 endonuclease [Neobacillus sp. PS3-34]